MSQLVLADRPVMGTPAVSHEAFEIEQAHDCAYTSILFGTPGGSKAVQELTWAAYSSGLLDTDNGLMTYQRARTFVAALPSAARTPEFAIDPDGEVAIEWYDVDTVLSISLNGSGRLAYVFEHEGAVKSGSGHFSIAIPDELMGIISYFK